MDHVAIMRKSWGLMEKILTGEKKIESRWYKFKRPPWNKVKVGGIVYFKNSAEPVKLKATVEKVLQFENLTPRKVREILGKYGKLNGIRRHETQKYFELFKNKKYCILMWLKQTEKVDPFEIDKTGFSAMSSWISVENIRKIKVK